MYALLQFLWLAISKSKVVCFLVNESVSLLYFPIIYLLSKKVLKGSRVLSIWVDVFQIFPFPFSLPDTLKH